MSITAQEFLKHMGWDKKSELAKLPNWYGIEGIKFIWHNEWADPEIEYKGKRCSCYIVEDTMWEDFTHDDDGERIPDELCGEDEFAKYMKENAETVKYLCEIALFGKEESEA